MLYYIYIYIYIYIYNTTFTHTQIYIYIYIKILSLVTGMGVNIFQEGETIFSFLSIYLQRPLCFNSARNSTDALVNVKHSFIGNGIFLQCSM